MNSWITYNLHSKAAPIRLFLFAHAGGGSAAFRGWNDRIGAEIELGFIQLPGHESRLSEKPFSSIAELIPGLVDALSAHIDLRFAFYGQSLGARIAFETARELRRRGGRLPAHLFVAASQAPQLGWQHPPMNGLQTAQFLSAVQERYGSIPQQVAEDEELCNLLLPALRADVTMVETYLYTPGLPLDCGITAFGGLQDHTVSQLSLEQWQTQTCREFHLHMVPGNHFFPQSAESRLPESIAAELIDIVRTQSEEDYELHLKRNVKDANP
ncbi:MAG TPA: thioesterase domain-containing protein [Terracidiphilus sp.]